jgi:predicted negative regulator of RcsB-dependent stress response
LETYNSDEQLQLLRQWLRDNGPALLAGLLLGALLIGGWSGWKSYSTHKAERASVEFEQLKKSLQTGDNKAAETSVIELTENYSGTPYATLAALMLAADQVQRGQFEPALKQYQWAVENAPDRKLSHVARLRRARLLWSMGRSEEALAQLDARRLGSFEPLFSELRGDIQAGQGRKEEARKSYTEAMANAATPEQRANIELKLNDLNTADPVSASNTPVAPTSP